MCMCIVTFQPTLEREVESFSHTDRAGHCTPYDRTVWGCIMAPVTVLLAVSDCCVYSHFYMGTSELAIFSWIYLHLVYSMVFL